MNRRAHIRQNVEIPVHLRNEAAQQIRARTGDFCLGGLRVVTTPAEAAEAMPFAPGEKVEVLSALPGRRGLREVTLSARVARVEPSGLGLRFESPDAIALLAFHNHVRQVADSGLASGIGGAADSPILAGVCANTTARIVFDLRSLVERELQSVMQRLVAEVEDDLVWAVSGAESESLAATYLAASHQLPGCAALMTRSFVSRVCNGIEDVALGADPDSAGRNEMPLSSDHDEFKGWLAVKSMAARAEGRFNHELLPLQMRFNELFNAAIGVRQNPLHPASICRAFSEALRVTGLSPKVYWIIFEGLESVLIGSLDHLYRKVNALLVSEGLIPDLDMDRLLGARARA